MKINGRLFSVITILSILLTSCGSSKDGGKMMVATLQLKEPVEGICNQEKVYVLLPFMEKTQQEATCQLTDEELSKKLQEEVVYLSDHPDLNAEGTIGVMINCKGRNVKTDVSTASEYPELDEQVMAVFASLTKWTPGGINGVPVDSQRLIGFTVKDGIITVD
ncbi:MAG: energy transducer TonB [Bacteroidota bacterium]|nr:energy transducer TonB [Bacteroidota bacterium]MDX5429170.1 energy transducer TonB [Bacteroidota bacterium]MDX5506808.1 energy transducer TonB [Bacteroidota bacterium]